MAEPALLGRLSAWTLVADPAGALYWPEQGLLVVADLHLEKGSAFAAPRRAAAALRHGRDAGPAGDA